MLKSIRNLYNNAAMRLFGKFIEHYSDNKFSQSNCMTAIHPEFAWSSCHAWACSKKEHLSPARSWSKGLFTQ